MVTNSTPLELLTTPCILIIFIAVDDRISDTSEWTTYADQLSIDTKGNSMFVLLYSPQANDKAEIPPNFKNKKLNRNEIKSYVTNPINTSGTMTNPGKKQLSFQGELKKELNEVISLFQKI